MHEKSAIPKEKIIFGNNQTKSYNKYTIISYF